MSLHDWTKNGWLIEHETSRQEILHLLKLAQRDLIDCQNASVSLDWRFNIAYNAALQCANAALAAAGFRASKDSHHYRVINSLEHTIRADGKLISSFDSFRKKRNTSEYDRAGAVSENELEDMIALAKYLYEAVKKWIQAERPDLMLS
jgi:uncharacterized protein (UPF0332 family)